MQSARFSFLPALLTLVGALSLSGCQQHDSDIQAEPSPLKRSQNIPSLKAPAEGPTLPDFGAIADVKAKKQAFFKFLEPQITQENRHIDSLRQHLKQLQQLFDEQQALHPEDRAWLQQAARLYRVDSQSAAEQLDTLLTKLGPIPPALVKAQAANESAWGTSRFARQANNLFGQWCFKPGCGIAPLQRGPDQTHEVQAFDSVAAGLRSYFTNLNGNRSYADLRQIRRCLQRQQQPATGRALAAGLVNYSARGGHYVEELQSMIRINRLESWSADWWGEHQSNHPCFDLVQVTIDLPDPVAAEPEPTSDKIDPATTLAQTTSPADPSLIPVSLEPPTSE